MHGHFEPTPSGEHFSSSALTRNVSARLAQPSPLLSCSPESGSFSRDGRRRSPEAWLSRGQLRLDAAQRRTKTTCTGEIAANNNSSFAGLEPSHSPMASRLRSQPGRATERPNLRAAFWESVCPSLRFMNRSVAIYLYIGYQTIKH